MVGWRLYRFYDEAFDLLYVGQSGDAFGRLLQHVQRQPWADEVASWQRDPVVYGSQWAVREAERLAIATEWPRYNVVHNGGNPHRVDPRRLRRPGARRVRGVGRWQRRVVAVLVAWLVVAGALWWAVAGSLPAGRGVLFGVLGSTVVCGYAWRRARRGPRRRRRRW